MWEKKKNTVFFFPGIAAWEISKKVCLYYVLFCLLLGFYFIGKVEKKKRALSQPASQADSPRWFD